MVDSNGAMQKSARPTEMANSTDSTAHIIHQMTTAPNCASTRLRVAARTEGALSGRCSFAGEHGHWARGLQVASAVDRSEHHGRRDAPERKERQHGSPRVPARGRLEQQTDALDLRPARIDARGESSRGVDGVAARLEGTARGRVGRGATLIADGSGCGTLIECCGRWHERHASPRHLT
eukprot:5597834-Prymnesium_polylepis.1